MIHRAWNILTPGFFQCLSVEVEQNLWFRRCWGCRSKFTHNPHEFKEVKIQRFTPDELNSSGDRMKVKSPPVSGWISSAVSSTVLASDASKSLRRAGSGASKTSESSKQNQFCWCTRSIQLDSARQTYRQFPPRHQHPSWRLWRLLSHWDANLNPTPVV